MGSSHAGRQQLSSLGLWWWWWMWSTLGQALFSYILLHCRCKCNVLTFVSFWDPEKGFSWSLLINAALLHHQPEDILSHPRHKDDSWLWLTAKCWVIHRVLAITRTKIIRVMSHIQICWMMLSILRDEHLPLVCSWSVFSLKSLSTQFQKSWTLMKKLPRPSLHIASYT